MISRDEFDALRESVEALRIRVGELHPTVDEHDVQLKAVKHELRALASNVGRLTDLVTPLAMSLPRVERNVLRVLEILEQRTVIVDAQP